jgi:hypothetical protein
MAITILPLFFEGLDQLHNIANIPKALLALGSFRHFAAFSKLRCRIERRPPE